MTKVIIRMPDGEEVGALLCSSREPVKGESLHLEGRYLRVTAVVHSKNRSPVLHTEHTSRHD